MKLIVLRQWRFQGWHGSTRASPLILQVAFLAPLLWSLTWLDDSGVTLFGDSICRAGAITQKILAIALLSLQLRTHQLPSSDLDSIPSMFFLENSECASVALQFHQWTLIHSFWLSSSKIVSQPWHGTFNDSMYHDMVSVIIFFDNEISWI